MATEYRVVFAGAVLDGHKVEEVRQTAGKRLKVTPEQLIRLFSGKPVVLKKGLDMSAAEKYVGELNNIGMKVRVEPIPEVRAVPVPEPVQPDASSWPQLQGYEAEKTQLADAEALMKYLGTSEPVSHLAANPVTPTYIVPKDEIVATRQRLEQALAAQDDLARAPTVIVSPKSAGSPHAAQEMVSGQFDSHLSPNGHPVSVMKEDTGNLLAPTPKHGINTLIADEDTLKAYLESSSGSGPAGLPERPAGIQTFEAAEPPVVPTQLPPPLPADSHAEADLVPPPLPAPPAPPMDSQTNTALRRTVPVSPTQAQQMLSSSIYQTEYELPPPRKGLGLTLKILLGVIGVAIIAGAVVIVLIVIEAIKP